MNSKSKLSIEEGRAILNKNDDGKKYTDKEIEQIQEFIHELAVLALQICKKEEQEKQTQLILKKSESEVNSV